MIVYLVLYLHSLLLVVLGQTIPEEDLHTFVPDSEGDLLFLLDSSGSVSYYEFAKVKKFIGDLLRPFTFGPQDVQASIVHISTDPALEFPFDQHGSGKEIQKAIQDVKQRMGDTNTGKALSFVNENLSAGSFGSRDEVPKVMVWVTDGLSTDDISQPMQLLKDMGVTVFIVSTGRGSYLELSEAASQPPEEHLHFVDVDDLHIITKELRDSIIELIQAKRLQAHDITTTSIRLTWPRLLSEAKDESYTVEYAPEADTSRSLRMSLAGDQTGVILSNLTPNTTYRVTLTPESNVRYVQPQTIQVSTLPEPELILEVHDITATGFRLTWPKLLSQRESYIFECTPESDASRGIQESLSGDQDELVLNNLTPNTTYRVTLTPKSNVYSIKPQTIQVSTLPEPKVIILQVYEVTTTGLRLSWPKLLSQVEGESYLLEYSPESDTSLGIRRTLSGDQTEVVLSNLTPNTTYLVTLTAQSNVQFIRPQTVLVSTLPEPKTITLQTHDITATSFRLTWSQLLSRDHGESYLLEYAPESDTSHRILKSLPGDQTGVVLSNLSPDTTYEVTLTPKSNVQVIKPQTIQVSTLPEVKVIRLQVYEVTTTGLRLSWPRLLSQVEGESYLLEYSPESDTSPGIRRTLSGDQTEVVLSNLTPNTTYLVTLTAQSNVQFIRPQTVLVSTLPEPKIITLQTHDITATSFRLTWSQLLSRDHEESYLLEYAPESDTSHRILKSLPGDQTGVVLSNLSPDTTYEVTLTPKSNVQVIKPQTILVTTSPEPKLITLRVHDIKPTSFRLTWPKLLSQAKGESYLLEYALEFDTRHRMLKNLPGDETDVILNNLTPDTTYRVTLTPESSVQFVQPHTIRVTTFPEQITPTQILISEPSSHSFRVSWGPNLDSVAGYEIQYGPLPSNTVHKVKVDSTINSTVLENLKSNTTYLVTVAAIFKHGGEKALSAIACTEEKDAKVSYLHLDDLGSDSLKATWGSAEGDVQGYRVRCRRQAGNTSVVNVAPHTHNVLFTDMAVGTTNKICVKPIYKNGAGKSLCRTVRIHRATSAGGYPRPQS
ncbi:von Willebrand factor A domain-containing protein 1 isoform X2 [Spea bombifrons]|uniref:von Willebrand factor A domain-containing protein 1 isoform X2 n=1 Tax=Spea bombifrons TaxID=233779 RepID=UPI002349ECC3|nr:von Willebrand factor A domain-containing protein 1 isoform X2 [Spea bombifrons]